MTKTLFVENILVDANTAMVRTTFARFGEVVAVRLITTEANGQRVPCAFAVMASEEGARAALDSDLWQDAGMRLHDLDAYVREAESPPPEAAPVKPVAPPQPKVVAKLSPDQKRSLASIRKLIASEQKDTVVQGIELLMTLGDRAIALELADGLEIENTTLSVSPESEVQRRVKLDHRAPVAMAIARVSGMLDGVTALSATVRGKVSAFVRNDYPSDVHPLPLATLAGLPALETLTISGFGSAGRTIRIADLGVLPELNRLRIKQCEVDLTGIEQMPKLRDLYVQGPFTNEALLSRCSQLESLELDGRSENLDYLAPLTGLRSLSVDFHDVRSLEPLRPLVNLTQLTLTAMTELDSLEPLRHAISLTSLTLWRLKALSDLEPLGALENLTTLAIGWCGPVDLTPLATLPQLSRVSLHGLSQARGYEALARARSLQSLRIAGCNVSDLGPLAQAPLLATVELEDLGQLTSLLGLRGCTALRELVVRRCGNIQRVGDIATCTALRKLDLPGCTALFDVACIEPLQQLERLDIHETPVRDFTSLEKLKALRWFTPPSRRFRGQESTIRAALPECSIS